MPQTQPEIKQAIADERRSVLEKLQRGLEKPMIALAFIWLALFIVETLYGLGPVLTGAGFAIWGIFVVEFAVGFALAPDKAPYLKENWLKGLALIAPPLRIVRVFGLLRLTSAASAFRGLRLLRILSSANRGMEALSTGMGRHGFGYVIALTAVVILAGSAGIYGFEHDVPGKNIPDFGTALWWTAMIVTTMGSDYWPQTAAGRALCFLLAVYSFAVFGYVTANLATYFIGRDAEDDRAEIAEEKSIQALRSELAALREELRALKKADLQRGAYDA